MKSTDGITLVALVITVVVMLILAGVVIAIVLEGDGIFNRTRQAAETYNETSQEENELLQNFNNKIDFYIKNFKDANVNVNIKLQESKYLFSVNSIIEIINSENEIDYNNSKYVFTKSKEKLGKNINLYTDGSLSGKVTNIEKALGKGTWYLHVLIIDKDNFKVEKVSEECINIEENFDFEYTGNVQKVSLLAGNYQLECWGASGRNNGYATPGLGGYVKGKIKFENTTELYAYVGEAGDLNSFNYNQNTFNGGGYTHRDDDDVARGGGATDFRVNLSENQYAWNNENGLKNRIIVAGGGGSGGNSGAGSRTSGGDAGGLNSYKGSGNATGYAIATQTSGNAFGIGGPGLSGDAYSGSGGGYYGGKSSTTSPCDTTTGGSSFISGHNGCNAIDENSTLRNIIHTGQPNHYSGYIFYETLMIDGKGYRWTTQRNEYVGMPTHDGLGIMNGNLGNGYAKITNLN